MSAVEVRNLSHRYGERAALNDVEFCVRFGEIFGLLGPNGSGKTTLFRILCTLLPRQQGTATILGDDVTNAARQVRRRIGITFQSPSLDGKLTVAENLKHQGHLYALSGRPLRTRVDELLTRFQLADRRRDLVDTLSGGLKRRVELAKGLLHQPQLLLLDEPSTGLDPTARRELWDHLRDLQRDGMTILATTHMMDEADRCDRIGILDEGRLVALGQPDELRSELGGDGVTIHSRDPDRTAGRIVEQFGLQPQRIGSALRLRFDGNRDEFGRLLNALGDEIRSVEFGKPSLEDVFLAKTGHQFEAGGD
ncbi:MAG: ATP-binding cassette domain-containing protein [Planctomycetaceae bacterium]